MDSVINTLKFELEHGGPHVHFAAMILFIIIGIFVLHGIFRLFIEVLCRVTKVPRDSWRNIFRFMPTLLGILMGIQMAKNILNLPPFVQEMLSYHYHSVVIITVTFFCAHTVSSFLKDKLSKSGDKQAGELDYVPMPEAVKGQIAKSWGQIVDGAGKPIALK